MDEINELRDAIRHIEQGRREMAQKWLDLAMFHEGDRGHYDRCMRFARECAWEPVEQWGRRSEAVA